MAITQNEADAIEEKFLDAFDAAEGVSDGTLWEVVTANCFRQFPLPNRAV